MSNFDENDMVCNRKNEKLLFGGYEVDSVFLNNNIPTSYRLNDSSMFGGLAVPSGLLYLSNYSGLTNELKEMSGGSNADDSLINDDLYDKLFQLAQVGGENKINNQDQNQENQENQENQNKPKNTKRHRQSTKKTRKL